MDKLPKVSVICLCYNHEKYLREALNSVISQDYPKLEIVIVDDASSDNSVEIISDFLKNFPQIHFIKNIKNIGNCASFNKALAQISGDFVVDFALDDVLFSNRISTQIAFFLNQKENVAAVFSQADLINEKSHLIGKYYSEKKLINIEKYNVHKNWQALALSSGGLIATPTLLFRKSVFDELGGYDENLAYEDYDFLIRITEKYDLAFQNIALIQYRKHSASLSTAFYQKKQNPLLSSTLIILEKVDYSARNDREKKAFEASLRYHYRQAIIWQCKCAVGFFTLLKTLKLDKKQDYIWELLRFFNLPLWKFYQYLI